MSKTVEAAHGPQRNMTTKRGRTRGLPLADIRLVDLVCSWANGSTVARLVTSRAGERENLETYISWPDDLIGQT